MEYVKGNLLNAETEALVNAVNTVGVMGKGIALQFKWRFPKNYRIYRQACKKGELTVGKMFVFTESDLKGKKIIVNFPTKTHWRKKSEYSYVEEGLKDLASVIKSMNIKSISIPSLGCGNGGLEWEQVKNLIEKYLGHLTDVRILIFEPLAE